MPILESENPVIPARKNFIRRSQEGEPELVGGDTSERLAQHHSVILTDIHHKTLALPFAIIAI